MHLCTNPGLYYRTGTYTISLSLNRIQKPFPGTLNKTTGPAAMADNKVDRRR